MQCNSCGAANAPEAPRCQRCQIRLAPVARYNQSSAVPQLDFEQAGESTSAQSEPLPHTFGVVANPTSNRLVTPMQPDLFSHAPQGKVVRMRMTISSPAVQPGQQTGQSPSRDDHANDPLYARDKPAPRRPRTSASQADLNFGPPTHRPFANELKPMQGIPAAPLMVRFYSLLIDALVVGVFSLMFALAVFVAFRASGDRLSTGELLGMPWYLPAIVPVLLSIAYKALWAVFEHPTIGLQCFQLDVISMDGHRPTRAQRMVRVFAGWLTIGGIIGALWAVVSQERYSMQDMISQTFLTVRPE